MHFDFESFRAFKSIHIGYSGGLDSTVLLHLFANSDLKDKLNVVHVNHNLNANAKVWEQHCQSTCENLKVPFSIIRVNAAAEQGESPEAAARIARYTAFEKIVADNEVLLTAHHQDDQIETFFLQLLRGAGIKGLAAMPLKKSFAKGMQIRPLLNYSRVDLHAYAKTHQLIWVDDESNFDTNLQRNFLRHEVIPKLKQSWVGMHSALMRSLSHCQHANDLLDDLAAIDLKNCVAALTEKEHKLNRLFRMDAPPLSIESLLELSNHRRSNLLRYWIQQTGHSLPSQNKLHEIERSVLTAKADALPLVTWQATEVRRYRDKLYIIPCLRSFDSSQVIIWDDTRRPLLIPDLNITLTPELFQMNRSGFATAKVGFRQEGDKVKLLGRKGTHDIKKIFQEYGIPAWLRDRFPIFFLCNEKYFIF